VRIEEIFFENIHRGFTYFVHLRDKALYESKFGISIFRGCKGYATLLESGYSEVVKGMLLFVH
jgi:hypothetical protein